jgi:hypothetical protein
VAPNERKSQGLAGGSDGTADLTSVAGVHIMKFHKDKFRDRRLDPASPDVFFGGFAHFGRDSL